MQKNPYGNKAQLNDFGLLIFIAVTTLLYVFHFLL